MFIICDVEDKVRVDPGDLGRPLLDAVTAVIEQLYIDKASLIAPHTAASSVFCPKPSHVSCMQVLHDLGLVVTIYDILSIEGGFIYPSDGAAHYTVKFRLVVFKPFINEVLTGRLTRCDKCVCHILQMPWKVHCLRTAPGNTCPCTTNSSHAAHGLDDT